MWTTRLHRPSKEFWKLTPREIDACLRAYEDGERSQNMRFGTVAAAVLNSVRRDKRAKVWQWSDFFNDTKKAVAKTAEQIGASLDMLTALIKANRSK